ncbi:seminase-like [Lucilia sericata]|uniref:seminase-like n=1 Tax=Lucilia sericata TaxID=13632 RepID=UPI0018A808B9|nr:seminase-like [Lucilia sericata]
MPILFILFSLILALNQQINTFILNKTDQSARIVNGELITIDQAKFVVNLRFYEKFICGGSLVASKIVLTAAHCVDWLSPAELSIIGGATYLSEKDIKRSVSKIHIPEEYNFLTKDMDIALLELSEPMEGDNISTIELCNTKWNTGDEMAVYGWGRIAEDIAESSEQLRIVKVPAVEQSKCSDMYKEVGEITNSMFCAGDLKGKDSCKADSGGPAVLNDQLCGVVSWGEGCARHDFPGVYANIMFAIAFIDKIMNKYESH